MNDETVLALTKARHKWWMDMLEGKPFPKYVTEPMNPWTQTDAIKLCVLVENICPQYGCHVALTGGLLYKHGMRKDCDLLFYRIRQSADIDYDGLFDALKSIGLEKVKGYGFIIKATYEGKPVDCIFPEEVDGDSTSGEVVEIKREPLKLPPGVTKEQFKDICDWPHKHNAEELAKL